MKHLFILLAISTLFSCSNANPSADKPIVPLKIGNYWHYRFIKFKHGGDTMLVQDRYVRVVRDTTVAGERWFVVQREIGTTVDPSVLVVTNRSDGYYEGLANPKPSLPYPAVVGTAQVFKDMIGEGDKKVEYVDSLHVLSSDSSVTVPAGTFHSHVYRQVETTIVFGGSLIEDMYYTPGLGLVKSINYAPVSPYGPPFPTKIGEEILVDYKVN